MFKAENKNGLLKIPHLDQVSENFVSHSVFGDKFGKIAFPWENFVGTFGVCECKSETCLDWPPDAWHPEKKCCQKKKTNSLCRLVNCLFSQKLFDRFSHINDLHTRIDHETGETYKKFWSDLVEYYVSTDVDDEIGKIYGADADDDDPILKALSVEPYINLQNFIFLTEEAIRKAFRDLFKVRGQIKTYMTQSASGGQFMATVHIQ
jgi:hypothetical protein